MKKQDMYRYNECGLDNVFICGLKPIKDDKGEATYKISNINGLHKELSIALVNKETILTGKEIRFLRTEMGMTQSEMAELLKKEALTIGRWERGENPVDPLANLIIRMIAEDKLGLEKSIKATDLDKVSREPATNPDIKIDGRNPNNYKLVA